MNYLIRRKTKEDCAPVVHVATVAWNETYKGIVDDDFLNKLKENGLCKNYTKEDMKSITISDYTISGRVKNIQIKDQKVSAEKLRTLIGLKSTKFTIEKNDETVVFNVVGYGHGVGMSQVGANYYANNGMDYKEIIKHYYTGVEITKLD